MAKCTSFPGTPGETANSQSGRQYLLQRDCRWKYCWLFGASFFLRPCEYKHVANDSQQKNQRITKQFECLKRQTLWRRLGFSDVKSNTACGCRHIRWKVALKFHGEKKKSKLSRSCQSNLAYNFRNESRILLPPVSWSEVGLTTLNPRNFCSHLSPLYIYEL